MRFFVVLEARVHWASLSLYIFGQYHTLGSAFATHKAGRILVVSEKRGPLGEIITKLVIFCMMSHTYQFCRKETFEKVYFWHFYNEMTQIENEVGKIENPMISLRFSVVGALSWILPIGWIEDLMTSVYRLRRAQGARLSLPQLRDKAWTRFSNKCSSIFSVERKMLVHPCLAWVTHQ